MIRKSLTILGKQATANQSKYFLNTCSSQLFSTRNNDKKGGAGFHHDHAQRPIDKINNPQHHPVHTETTPFGTHQGHHLGTRNEPPKGKDHGNASIFDDPLVKGNNPDAKKYNPDGVREEAPIFTEDTKKEGRKEQGNKKNSDKEDRYTIDERKERQLDVKKAIIRSNIACIYALTRLLRGQKLISPPNFDDPLRKFAQKNEDVLRELTERGIEERVRPSLLTPLIGLGFSSLGVMSSLLGKTVSANVVFSTERAIEHYYDDCLRILNELDMEEKELRKLLCEIRDVSYELSEDLKSKYAIYDKHPTVQKARVVTDHVTKLFLDITRKV